MENQETEKISIFEESDEIREIELNGIYRHVKRGRNALFVLGALLPISEAVYLYKDSISLNFDVYTWIYLLALAVVFIGLAIWTNKKPDLPLLLGLIAYIILIILAMYVGYTTNGIAGIGQTLFSGILMKCVFIYLLGNGYKKAKQYIAMKEIVF